MKFLWTKNGKPGSKLIQWGLGQDCSHFALEHLGQVAEARMEDGFTTGPLADFLKRNTVVHTLEHRGSDTATLPLDLFRSVEKHCKGAPYDKNAVAWMSLWALKTKLLGGDPPTHNQWQDKKRFYCVEILAGSEAIIKAHLKVEINAQKLTPYDLFVAMAASPRLKVL